jgi:hypothetical protein
MKLQTVVESSNERTIDDTWARHTGFHCRVSVMRKRLAINAMESRHWGHVLRTSWVESFVER